MTALDSAGAFAADVPHLVSLGWAAPVRSVRRTMPGMNSQPAIVELDAGTFVVKSVAVRDADALDAGSATATRLARLGLATGEPLPTSAGRASLRTDDPTSAVHGRPAGSRSRRRRLDQAVGGGRAGRAGRAAELEVQLAAFSRLRGAVQAAYFSMRIATADVTGIADRAENDKGLRDAYAMLEENDGLA